MFCIAKFLVDGKRLPLPTPAEVLMRLALECCNP